MFCRIRESSFDTETGQWTVHLEACRESHVLSLRDPFSADDGEDVDWFYQKYSKFPLADTVKAKKVVGEYGKHLFRQTIGAVSSSSIFKCYHELREEGRLSEICIEVTGSVAFQRLHWEALRDDQPSADDVPLALQAEIIRRPLVAVTPDPSLESAHQISSDIHDTAPAWSLPLRPLNILLVVARPAGLRDVGLRVISRPLIDALSSSSQDCTLQARLDVVRPGSFEQLKSQLEKASFDGIQYDVVHFDLHGKLTSDRKEVLMSFQAQNGEGSNDVSGAAVASALKQHNIPMVVLNACSSAYETGQDNSSIGSILAKSGVSYVIAMRYDIQVASAATAIQKLYRKLLQKRSTSGLIAAIREAMFLEQSSGQIYGFEYLRLDWLLPIAYVGENPSSTYLASVQIRQSDHEIQSRSALAKSYESGDPHTTIGREGDILKIETTLYHEPKLNTVLIYGLRSVGKSTLIRHLCWWWAVTGLVAKVLWLDFANVKVSSVALVEKLADLLSLPSNHNKRSLTWPLLKVLAQGFM